MTPWTAKRLAVIYAATLGLFSAAALALWSIPGARPPFIPNEWSLAAVTFAVASLVFFLLYLAQSGWFVRAFHATTGALVAGVSKSFSLINAAAREVSTVEGALKKLLTVAILYVAVALILNRIGLAPAVGDWLKLEESVVTFFTLYSAAWIVAFFLLSRIGRFFHGITHVGSEDVSTYGPLLAWLFRRSLVLTALAQSISFLTSYLGVYILLSQRYEPELWVSWSIPIPGAIIESLELSRDAIPIEISNIGLISAGASALMSGIIWFFAALAVGSVLNRRPVPKMLYLFSIVFGLLSTYTAYIMWNGENATAEELRAGLRQTERLATEFRTLELASFDPVRAEVFSQIESQQGQLIKARRDAVQNELTALLDLRATAELRFSRIVGVGATFASEATSYQEYHECELERGCMTGAVGLGAVADNLLVISRAFDRSAESWEAMRESWRVIIGFAGQAARRAQEHLLEERPVEAQQELQNLRDELHRAFALDPIPILESLYVDLQRPLMGQLSLDRITREEQRAALALFQDRLSARAEQFKQIILDWENDIPAFPRPAQLSEVAADTQFELSELNGLVREINAVSGARLRLIDDVERTVAALRARVQSETAADTLIGNRDFIASEINTASQALLPLRTLDLNSLTGRIERLNATRNSVETFVDGLNVTYPQVGEFTLTPLHFAVLTFFYLSLVALMIQVLLDFGYTIAVTIGVSTLREEREQAATPLRTELQVHGSPPDESEGRPSEGGDNVVHAVARRQN